VALIGTFEGSDETINVGAEIVASFNGAMIAYCNRQVYARDSEFVYLRQNGERPRRGASVLNDIHFCKKRQ
jgi:hypothetical protein